MTRGAYRPRVELCVRSLCPTGAQQYQERVVERLHRLEEAGRITEFSITVWGKQVPRDGGTAVADSILERIEAFEAWSDRRDTSLASFFETHRTDSLLTDESRLVVVLPMLCLAEYHDGELQYVTPCADDGTVCTVLDRLDVLEAGSGGDEPRAVRG